MPILADQVDVVVGVDTHTDTHTAAVLSAAGAVLDQLTVPTDTAGAAVLVAWARQHSEGLRLAWVIDGARSHGVGLTGTCAPLANRSSKRPAPAGRPAAAAAANPTPSTRCMPPAPR